MPSTPPYYVSEFRIKVAGVLLAADVAREVVEIRVEDQLELAGMFRIRFLDPHLALIDRPPFAIGDEVVIEMGYSRNIAEVITGLLEVIQPSFPASGVPNLTVIGYDRSQSMRHGTNFRQFEEMNDSGIVEQVAELHGLTAQVSGSRLPTRATVSHLGTDWELLEDLAVRNGFEVRVRARTLYFQTPEAVSPPVELVWGQSLLSFTLRVTASGLPQTMRVRDLDDVQDQPVVSTRDIGEINGGFQQGAGRFRDAVAASMFAQGEMLARDYSAPTVVEADALADSLLSERAESLVTGTGTCMGEPRLKSGEMVSIQAIGPRFSGPYRLRQVIHIFGEAGYQTQFDVGPRGSTTLLQQLRSSVAGRAAVRTGRGESHRMMPIAAQVADNKDPSGRGRVRVSFPQFSASNRGPWARIATLAAGQDTGTVFLPEVGDDVVVAFEQGDINRPIVLGGLWDGAKKPPEANADGKNNVQMIRTKAGHVIKFDNTEGSESLLIQHSSGSKITLAGEGTVTIEAKKRFTLKSEEDIDLIAANVNVTVTGKMDVSG